jgi:microcystin-dependent protein
MPALPASANVGGEEYIGMVKLLAGSTIPQGWALCDGRQLPVSQHPALFALLGTMYGGDGDANFALPKLVPTGRAVPGHSPEQLVAPFTLAIKVANAPATTEAGIELRLQHLRRAKTRLVR